ncbi:6870_t:CDS:2, partial [Rhizophagus irregularis]
MGLQITKCCFCIPLKAGVIIISLLWLFIGLFFTIFRVLGLKRYIQDKGLKEVSEEGSTIFTFEIMVMALDVYATLGATFGLYAVIFSKKYRMLKLYSTLGFIAAGIEVIIDQPYEIVFEILFSVYSSLTISSYACRKKEKEAAAVRNLNESSDQTNHNFVV